MTTSASSNIVKRWAHLVELLKMVKVRLER